MNIDSSARQLLHSLAELGYIDDDRTGIDGFVSNFNDAFEDGDRLPETILSRRLNHLEKNLSRIINGTPKVYRIGISSISKEYSELATVVRYALGIKILDVNEPYHRYTMYHVYPSDEVRIIKSNDRLFQVHTNASVAQSRSDIDKYIDNIDWDLARFSDHLLNNLRSNSATREDYEHELAQLQRLYRAHSERNTLDGLAIDEGDKQYSINYLYRQKRNELIRRYSARYLVNVLSLGFIDCQCKFENGEIHLPF